MNIWEKYPNYIGDINLEHGGRFFDISEWKHGYVTVLDVIDLDSATGFTGAVLVEHKVVYINDPEIIRSARKYCGIEKLHGDGNDRKLAIADAVCSCGHYDPDDSWDGYRNHWSSVYLEKEYIEYIKYDQDGHIEDLEADGQDGWIVEGIIPDGVDLLDFLEDEGHLRNF